MLDAKQRVACSNQARDAIIKKGSDPARILRSEWVWPFFIITFVKQSNIKILHVDILLT